MNKGQLEGKQLSPLGLCGLVNIGNTCYMNSALQSLSNCPPLTRYFLKSAHLQTRTEKGKMSVAKCYRNLINDIWNRKRQKFLNPCQLLQAVQSHNSMFRGYSQQDTQEFLRCLMDRLHEELKQPVLNLNECTNDDEEISVKHGTVSQRKLLGGNSEGSRDMPSNQQAYLSNIHDVQGRISKKQTTSNEVEYGSIITNVFDGKLLSTVQCLTCKRLSNRVETFQDLSLPIPSKEEMERIHKKANLDEAGDVVVGTGWSFFLWEWIKSWFLGPEIQLQDCLAAFFTSDELKGDNMYSCEKCKKLRNGVKYSRVNSLPEVLCIHLKRFRHELFYSSKINTYISFPLDNLDVKPFLSKECYNANPTSNYDLTAAITHFGSVGGGHYIAHAKNCINNRWYEFNDSQVNEVNESAVLNTEAYVLFYTLRDTDAERYRRNAINELKSSTLQNPEEQCYLSKNWFIRFDACINPGPISNYNLLCKHGAVRIGLKGRINDIAIPIPRTIFNSFLDRFDGGPVITSLDVCATCQMLIERATEELETFTQLHETFQQQRQGDVCAYKLSMTWYKSWHEFASGKILEPPGAINNSHVLEDRQSEGNTFGCISEDTWLFLYSRYGGGPVIVVNDVSMETDDSQ